MQEADEEFDYSDGVLTLVDVDFEESIYSGLEFFTLDCLMVGIFFCMITIQHFYTA